MPAAADPEVEPEPAPAAPAAPVPSASSVPPASPVSAPSVLAPATGTAAAPGASEIDLFNLEEQVARISSVTKTEQTAEEAPAIVDIVTRTQIREWGYQSLADVLRHVIGFYVIDDHILPNVAVRGYSGGLFAESSIIKLMLDGQSLSFRSTSGNWLGPEAIPITAIERVEIIRGPASALYGADAFLGVVNIVTRQGEGLSGADVQAAVGVSRSIPGSPGADLDITAGARRGPLDIVVGARIGSEDRSGLGMPATSPSPTIPFYNRQSTGATGLDLGSMVGFLKFSLQLPRATLTLSSRLASIDRGAEFAPWTQLSHGLDSAGRSNETRVQLYQVHVNLRGQFQLRPNLSLTVDGSFFHGRPGSGDRIEVGSDVVHMRRQLGSTGTDWNAEIQAKLPRSVVLIAGLGTIYDVETLPSVQRVLKFDIGSLAAGSTLDAVDARGTKALYNFGAYAQIMWTPIKRYLTLTGGVRYDYHNIYGSQPSGRLGAVSQLTDKLTVKVLFGSAFKAPSPLLLYAVPLQVGDVLGNPSLKPQYVYTLEGEVSYRPRKYLSLATGLAYNSLKDAAGFTLRGSNQVAVNVGQVSTISWETRIELSFQDWIKGYALGEYNYTVRSTGEIGYRAQLFGSDNIVYPKGIVRLGALGRIPKVPLRLGLDAQYVGPRRASEANTLGHGGAYELPDYWMLNASISTVGLQLLPDRETVLMVTGRNLLNVSAPDPGFAGFDYPLTATTVWFQLRQTF